VFTQLSRRAPRRFAFQFVGVGGEERPPSIGIAMELTTQRIAWRDDLHPKIDMRLFLRQAARPKAIDQHAEAILL
jgi:hypothetical protein